MFTSIPESLDLKDRRLLNRKREFNSRSIEDGRWLRLEVFQWNKVRTALKLLSKYVLLSQWLKINIVEIAHRIKKW